MNFRRIVITLSLALLILGNSAAAQALQTGETMATSTGRTFTAADLTGDARRLYDNLPAVMAEARTEELENAVNDTMFAEEAKLRRITVDKLLELEVSRKVPNPADAELQKLYDANRAQLGEMTFAEAKPALLRYVRRDGETAAFAAFLAALSKKYKVTTGVDVNSPALKPADVVATVGTQKITAAAFNDRAKIAIFSKQYQAYQMIDAGLRQTIYNNLVMAEAKALKLESEDLIAREITNKLGDTPGATYDSLEIALRDRLFKKYDVKIVYVEPDPPVQNVSADDDPAQGDPKAAVTVIVFSDFQCPVCAAVHPMVKETVQQYGSRVRLVMRDFPLTSLHADAQKAAEAAAAANTQGKYFEYIDILYANQKALDVASLKRYASDLKLDRVKFDAELDKGVYTAEVAKDVADGEAAGIQGTPTIFVNGMRLMQTTGGGLKKLIDRALSQKTSITK